MFNNVDFFNYLCYVDLALILKGENMDNEKQRKDVSFLVYFMFLGVLINVFYALLNPSQKNSLTAMGLVLSLLLVVFLTPTLDNKKKNTSSNDSSQE